MVTAEVLLLCGVPARISRATISFDLLVREAKVMGLRAEELSAFTAAPRLYVPYTLCSLIEFSSAPRKIATTGFETISAKLRTLFFGDRGRKLRYQNDDLGVGVALQTADTFEHHDAADLRVQVASARADEGGDAESQLLDQTADFLRAAAGRADDADAAGVIAAARRKPDAPSGSRRRSRDSIISTPLLMASSFRRFSSSSETLSLNMNTSSPFFSAFSASAAAYSPGSEICTRS